MKDHNDSYLIATMVLSGKALHGPFESNTLSTLLPLIKERLLQQNVILGRRIVTLSNDNAKLAPDFIKYGFCVEPADDEDMQVAAIASAAVYHEKTETLVLAFGHTKPSVHLLRFFAGKTKLILITSEPLEDEIRQYVDGVVLYDKALPNKDDLVPDKSKPVAISKGSSKAEKAKCAPTPLVQKQTAQTVKSSDGDTLPQSAEVDPYEELKANANAWNDALEKILLENNKKYDAAQAIARLNESFLGIYSLYWEWRDIFRKLLDVKKNRLVEEDGAPATFYHATHDSMNPLLAIDNLRFNSNTTSSDDGGEVESVSQRESLPRYKRAARSFEELTDDADCLRQQSEWSANRLEIMNGGYYDHALDITPRDNKIDAICEQSQLFRWQINPNYTADMTVDDFRQFAKIYRVLSEVFELLVKIKKIKEDRQRLEPSFVVNCLQIAADAQCLLKTTLKEFNIPIEKDSVQSSAFKLLTGFREKRYPTWTLSHMCMEDSFHLKELPALEERLLNCRQEFENRMDSARKIKREIGNLKFLCGKIRNAKPQNDYEFDQLNETWNSVVEKVTNLCKNGVPYSSVELREVLSDVIWEIPDEIEITEEFARVRREIDLVAMLAEEKQNSIRGASDTKVDSNEARAVRNRYKGRKLVFVGGAPTPHVRKRLENAFGAEILWSEFDHGDSLDRFNSLINDPDVKLLMVYIPWCSHAHSRDLKYRVEKAGKEFVRLPKGTSPDQIANSICDQLRLDVAPVIEEYLALGND